MRICPLIMDITMMAYMVRSGNHGRRNNLPTDRGVGVSTMKKRIEVKDLDDLKLYARKVAIKRGRTIKMLDNDGMWIFKKDGKVFKKEVENGRV